MFLVHLHVSAGPPMLEGDAVSPSAPPPQSPSRRAGPHAAIAPFGGTPAVAPLLCPHFPRSGQGGRLVRCALVTEGPCEGSFTMEDCVAECMAHDSVLPAIRTLWP